MTNNFDFVNESVYDRYIWNLKFDHRSLQTTESRLRSRKKTSSVLSVAAFPGPLGQGLEQYQRPDNWRVNHDLVIKPNVLLHTTFGYTRQRQIWNNPYQKGAASALRISGPNAAMPTRCLVCNSSAAML